MSYRKILLNILIIQTGFILIDCNNGFLSFKLLKCKVSDEFVYSNFTCYAKPFSRNFSTITKILSFKKPVLDLFVTLFILLLFL